MKNIEIKGLEDGDLNKYSLEDLTRSENGKQTIAQNSSFESRQKAGLKNKETGHIQKLGKIYGPIMAEKWAQINGIRSVEEGYGIHAASDEQRKEWAKCGGLVGGISTRDSGKLKEISKLGNEANQQKYGERIIATNLITGESWEYISKHEAARDTDVPTCTIRKILRGEQPKTKTGWTFTEK